MQNSRILFLVGVLLTASACGTTGISSFRDYTDYRTEDPRIFVVLPARVPEGNEATGQLLQAELSKALIDLGHYVHSPELVNQSLSLDQGLSIDIDPQVLGKKTGCDAILQAEIDLWRRIENKLAFEVVGHIYLKSCHTGLTLWDADITNVYRSDDPSGCGDIIGSASGSGSGFGTGIFFIGELVFAAGCALAHVPDPEHIMVARRTILPLYMGFDRLPRGFLDQQGYKRDEQLLAALPYRGHGPNLLELRRRELPTAGWKVVGQFKGHSCNMNGNTPAEKDIAMRKLRYAGAEGGANALLDTVCQPHGISFTKNCASYLECVADGALLSDMLLSSLAETRVVDVVAK